MTLWPPMYMGYSRPNSEATFFRASSMALRFSGFEKSMNGSLENSETWIFASAVAMADFLLDRQTRDCTARVEFATSAVARPYLWGNLGNAEEGHGMPCP